MSSLTFKQEWVINQITRNGYRLVAPEKGMTSWHIVKQVLPFESNSGHHISIFAVNPKDVPGIQEVLNA